jgi:hypothetical protein
MKAGLWGGKNEKITRCRRGVSLSRNPDFDLKAHLFRAAIPAPGTMRELDDMVAQIGSTLLDRSRPLWEIWFLEGLEGDRVAIVHKIHHCMADGKAYLGLLTTSRKISVNCRRY